MKTCKYILIIAVLGLMVFWILKDKKVEPVKEPVVNDTADMPKPDVKNLTYDVDGDVFNLKNGKGEISVPDSSIKSLLYLFDEVYGDLDADGDIDSAAWLVNDPGGTGRFFYGVLAINNGKDSKPTSAMFLGDRIAPQNIEIKEGRAVYNFKERKGTDPMTAEPTVEKSVWVHYDKVKNEIGEWVKDFEGESNIPR